MKAKILLAAMSAIALSGCGEAPVERERVVVVEKPASASKYQIAEEYSRCYISTDNEAGCKDAVAEEHGRYRSEDAIDDVVTDHYLGLYELYQDDDIAEVRCAEKYGVETCDEIEDRFEHITDPKDNNTAEMIGAAAAGAVVGNALSSDSKKHKKPAVKVIGKAPVKVQPAVVSPTKVEPAKVVPAKVAPVVKKAPVVAPKSTGIQLNKAPAQQPKSTGISSGFKKAEVKKAKVTKPKKAPKKRK